MKSKKHQTFRAGFSLIELLVVISIIATLTAIILPNFMSARERARDGQKKQDLLAVKNALRLYYNDNQTYPPGICADGGGCLESYISQYFPAITGIGFTFSYEQKNSGDGFVLLTGLESSNGDDDVDSQEKCGLGSAIEGYFAICAQ